VAQQLGDALAKIRGGSLDCEFQLPKAPAGEALDYQLINVEVTSEGAPRDLFYVGSAAGCDEVELGWYYDVDPLVAARVPASPARTACARPSVRAARG
jgi:hypothetical protein